MRSPMRFLAQGLCAVLIVAAPVGAQEMAAEPQMIQVTGEGRVSDVPDMAAIRLGVVTEGVDPGDAVGAMSAPMNGLLDRLDTLGIDPRDVQTSEMRLSPVYAQGDAGVGDGTRITGYEASSDVSVLVRDLTELGDILNQAVSTGANRFDGLSFSMSDPLPARDAALAAAVEDAQRKAQILAEAAGMTLGPVLQITEQGGGARPAPMMMDLVSAAAPRVAPGSLETSVQILIRFQLLP